MRMGQGVRTGFGHGGITCVLQTQFSSLSLDQKLSIFWNDWRSKKHNFTEIVPLYDNG